MRTHRSIEFLESRLQLAAFYDDFNRPDSSVVGNGWSPTTQEDVGHLAIVSNQLSATDSGRAGISRPFDLTTPVSISAQVFEQSGYYPDLLGRYGASFALRSNGHLQDNGLLEQGYGIRCYRGDYNYNDSAVI